MRAQQTPARRFLDRCNAVGLVAAAACMLAIACGVVFCGCTVIIRRPVAPRSTAYPWEGPLTRPDGSPVPEPAWSAPATNVPPLAQEHQ